MPRLLTAVALLVGIAAPAVADTMVERVLVAHGGRARVTAVQTRHDRGTLTTLHGEAAPLERWFVRPDRLRLDIRDPSGGESRILSGDRSWKDGRTATGPLHDAMVLQAARIALPGLLAEHPVQEAGTRIENGRPRRVLVMSLGPAATLEVEVDADSALILRSRGVMEMAGSRIEFRTDYADHRTVDGVLLAHREDHWAMGVHTGTSILEKIELNGTIAPEAFRP